MKSTNTRYVPLMKSWALNASRALNLPDIGILSREAYAGLFGWSPPTALGILGTRLGIGIIPGKDVVLVVMETADTDDTVLRSGWRGFGDDAKTMIERIMVQHVRSALLLDKAKGLT